MSTNFVDNCDGKPLKKHITNEIRIDHIILGFNPHSFENKNKKVIHINGDKLDNRRENLKIINKD